MAEDKLNKKLKKYAEILRCIHNAASETFFAKKFAKLSQAGNRRGMIEILKKLPKVKNLVIDECFESKNNDLARELLAKALDEKEKHKEDDVGSNFSLVDQLLNKALFTCSKDNGVYLEILMQRALWSYQFSKFHRCLKDTNAIIQEIPSKNERHEELKIESLLMETECYKRLKLEEKMKNALNSAMREMTMLVSSRSQKSGNAENLGEQKLVYLKKHLRKFAGITPKIRKTGCSSPKITLPSLFGGKNKQLKFCSDAVALGQDASRGRFLYALKDIPAGSVIIIDRPLSFCTEKEAFHRNCLHCHVSLNFDDNVKVPCNSCRMVSFCSKKCRCESWDSYHKYECTIFRVFFLDPTTESPSNLAYRTTIAQIFTSGKLKIPDDEEISKLEAEETSAFSLVTHCAEAGPRENLYNALRSVFLAKCLEFVLKQNDNIQLDDTQTTKIADLIFRNLQIVKCNAYEIVENIRDENTRVWEPRNVGGAIYTTVSLTNHSCYPNVVRHSYPQGTVIVRTLRYVKKGSEILDCYGPHFLTNCKNDRQKMLSMKYNFVCKCEACENDWSKPTKNKETKLPCKGKKFQRLYNESAKNRIEAISFMYNGDYEKALVLLQEHSNLVDKFFAPPSFEAIKTQQSIVQCFNSTSNTAQ